MRVTRRRFSEIHCPLCMEKLRIRKGKPRTLKQWRISLMNHLIASRRHHLTIEQAESIIDNYFKSLEGS